MWSSFSSRREGVITALGWAMFYSKKRLKRLARVLASVVQLEMIISFAHGLLSLLIEVSY